MKGQEIYLNCLCLLGTAIGLTISFFQFIAFILQPATVVVVPSDSAVVPSATAVLPSASAIVPPAAASLP